jgi:hypothetical protein
MQHDEKRKRSVLTQNLRKGDYQEKEKGVA